MGSPDRRRVPSSSASDHVSTELAARRTGMSFQRTRMSADRTLMSVIRTSLSLIGFGFTIYQVFQKLYDAQLLEHADAPRRFGVTLASSASARAIFPSRLTLIVQCCFLGVRFLLSAVADSVGM